ncbi:MAG: 4-hydroxy-tetrahydrodipicolinate synthase [Prevotellaceae bacterium]|jgi:4-hydroxy-tetrahydrodipicolinate synthase|nr:4-hydroxy-tetrahydrodipicolinate synthase [Prevotellaceae bacterium]
MKKKLSGVGVALITPFGEDKSLDFSAMEQMLDFVAKGGVDFLVVLGTTAESPTLDADEKKRITFFVTEYNAGKLPVVLGVGGNNTNEVVKAVKAIPDSVDAVLSVTPYYNKPQQQGLYEHFTAIADASPKPLVLYNVPGRTGVNMTADTSLRLAEHKNITAIKEASGDLRQMGYILRNRPADFSVLSGDDGLTLAQMSMGADGIISVAANAFPAQFCKMVHAAANGDFNTAAAIHLKLLEAFDLLFAEGNPAGVKAAASLQGLIENVLRLPLIPASETLMNKFKSLNLER